MLAGILGSNGAFDEDYPLATSEDQAICVGKYRSITYSSITQWRIPSAVTLTVNLRTFVLGESM